jgi:hypothetical protein
MIENMDIETNLNDHRKTPRYVFVWEPMRSARSGRTA